MKGDYRTYEKPKLFFVDRVLIGGHYGDRVREMGVEF